MHKQLVYKGQGNAENGASYNALFYVI